MAFSYISANCKKLLDSGRITEHDGDMYCGSCYGKFFGPKGYGFGGGAGTLSMDDGAGYKVRILLKMIFSCLIAFEYMLTSKF